MTTTIDNTFERITEQLDGLRQTGQDKYQALCPAHDDTIPSLSVMLKDDKILLYCHSGCSLDEICKSLGIKKSDLFEENLGNKKASPRREFNPTNLLESVEIASYPYYDETGNLVYTIKRYHQKEFKVIQPNGRPGLNGQSSFLYRLPELLAANPAEPVLILEGEKDVDTAVSLGLTATTNPFGAKKWDESFNQYFEGHHTVVIGDNDEEGKKRVHRIAGQLKDIAASVKVIEALPGVGEKGDLSDWAEAGGTAKALSRLIEDTPLYESKETVPEDDETDAVDPEILEKGKAFAATVSEKPLDMVFETIKELGVAGEAQTAKIIYLALTSRLFDKPVNIVVKGNSSGGKSFVVEQTLKLFPSRSLIARTSMSPKTLAYTDADFKHKTLVIYEAAGISEDWDYLLRSLLSEGRLDYEFVEKTNQGLRTRVITKEGPTNCILTTTSYSLHPENETRLLSLSIADTPEQTKAILLARARAAEEPQTTKAVDVSEWQAYQAYLAHQVLKESVDVVIPFATDLAEKIDPKAIRLRRDIDQVFTLIKTHALLSIADRQRDEKGRVMAEITDYEAVRELVNPILSYGIGAAIKEEVKETVKAAVKLIGPKIYDERFTTYKELAKHLNLDESTVSRRVGEAVKCGYLNKEGGHGKVVKITMVAEAIDDTILEEGRDVSLLPELDGYGGQNSCKGAIDQLNLAKCHADPVQDCAEVKYF